MKKIALISSKGGHLTEIIELKELYKNYDRFWVTMEGPDTILLLKNEKKYFAFFPESRNIINFFRNLLIALIILRKEKPNLLISCGAGIAIPFFIVAKILRMRLIYIESYDYVDYPSLTGRLLYNLVDLFIVQHKIQKKWYPKASYWGSLL